MRDRREGSRGIKKRCKPGWKIRGKRREGRQNRAEGRKALEDGGAPCPELDLSLGGLGLV